MATESACKSKGGVFRKTVFGDGGGKCYTYYILQRICLMVAYTEHPETASYTWEYRGGCFKDGQIAVYDKAVPGTDYMFDFIPIEVREDESLYGKLRSTGENMSNTLYAILHGLGTIFLVLSIVSGILFAMFYFKAMAGIQGGSGSSMKH